MAMSGPALEALIQTAVYAGLQAQYGSEIAGLSGPAQAKIQAEWTKLSTAISKAGTPIVNYIVANAVVTTSDAQGGTNTGTVA